MVIFCNEFNPLMKLSLSLGRFDEAQAIPKTFCQELLHRISWILDRLFMSLILSHRRRDGRTDGIILHIRRSSCIWHSEDRALWYILTIEANKMHNFSNIILICNSTCSRQTYCLSSGVLILYTQQLVFVIQLCRLSA